MSPRLQKPPVTDPHLNSALTKRKKNTDQAINSHHKGKRWPVQKVQSFHERTDSFGQVYYRLPGYPSRHWRSASYSGIYLGWSRAIWSSCRTDTLVIMVWVETVSIEDWQRWRTLGWLPILGKTEEVRLLRSATMIPLADLPDCQFGALAHSRQSSVPFMARSLYVTSRLWDAFLFAHYAQKWQCATTNNLFYQNEETCIGNIKLSAKSQEITYQELEGVQKLCKLRVTSNWPVRRGLSLSWTTQIIEDSR